VPTDLRLLFERWIKAMNDRDMSTLVDMLHPDFVVDYPQSGERLRGFESFRRMIEEYPSGLPENSVDAEHAEVVEGDERWAISPGYTVVPMTDPDRYTTIVRIAYPDGSWWHTVSIAQLRDGKIYRLESYFAPELPAPLAESIASFPHG
jgi:hypothetical protein